MSKHITFSLFFSLQVILSLTNNWNSTGSVDQFVSWSPTAHVHEDFFNDPTCMQLYQQYASAIINRVNYINGCRCNFTVLLHLCMIHVHTPPPPPPVLVPLCMMYVHMKPDLPNILLHLCMICVQLQR